MKENNIKNEINEDDVKMKALANLPYLVDKIEIVPPLLLDIARVSEEKYYYYLSILNINLEDLVDIKKNKISKEELEKISSFDILSDSFLKSEESRDIINDAFKFFLNNGQDITVNFANNQVEFILSNDLIINSNNYENIKKVIQIQNSMGKRKKKYNPVNKNVEKFAQLVEEAEKKKNKNSNLTLYDLISIYSSIKHKDISKVFRTMNIFQFNNQFNRLQMDDDYNLTIKTIMAGGSEIDLKEHHFMRKVDTD